MSCIGPRDEWSFVSQPAASEGYKTGRPCRGSIAMFFFIVFTQPTQDALWGADDFWAKLHFQWQNYLQLGLPIIILDPPRLRHWVQFVFSWEFAAAAWYLFVFVEMGKGFGDESMHDENVRRIGQLATEGVWRYIPIDLLRFWGWVNKFKTFFCNAGLAGSIGMLFEVALHPHVCWLSAIRLSATNPFRMIRFPALLVCSVVFYSTLRVRPWYTHICFFAWNLWRASNALSV